MHVYATASNVTARDFIIARVVVEDGTPRFHLRTEDFCIFVPNDSLAELREIGERIVQLTKEHSMTDPEDKTETPTDVIPSEPATDAAEQPAPAA